MGASRFLTACTLQSVAGEVLGIIGYNGMGKTTLDEDVDWACTILGRNHPFDGRDITRETVFFRARSGIGYVPQGREVFPRLSVRDNLRMGSYYRRRTARADGS